ncbi:vitelline membrane outer layer protein 1-like [Sceloporus undulatus]|uniref:vitelline membrane outer layer protein 1-like n=1 Tax=Sceloporus undulatus TaxID=8520 RepID=UPI001C4D2253|nr:vitelline membrane outer layer protein 1-like [Sceloporus undulatus]
MDLSVSAVLFLILSFGLWDSDARKHHTVLTVPNGGKWGTWGGIALCPKGFANGFSLKVQPYVNKLLANDDTFLNSIRLLCSNGDMIESKAGMSGTWTKPVKCRKGHLVSFSMQVKKSEGLGDDTSATNIKFRCEDGTEVSGESSSWRHPFGPWSKRCPSGSICGMQTKVESKLVGVEETSLNDVKFFCCD